MKTVKNERLLCFHQLFLTQQHRPLHQLTHCFTHMGSCACFRHPYVSFMCENLKTQCCILTLYILYIRPSRLVWNHRQYKTWISHSGWKQEADAECLKDHQMGAIVAKRLLVRYTPVNLHGDNFHCHLLMCKELLMFSISRHLL